MPRVVQINLHPNDFPTMRSTLRHQLEVWGDQVDRFHVTFDGGNVSGGHYRSIQFDNNLASAIELLRDLRKEFSKLVVDEVDYSEKMIAEVSRFFFRDELMPVRAWNGSPFYAYLFGIVSCDSDEIVHFDGDMLFGGDGNWSDEAFALLYDRTDVAFVAPWAGPPMDAVLHARRPGEVVVAGFPHVSTRIFATSVASLREKGIIPLPIVKPNARERIYAWVNRSPGRSVELERLISMKMKSTNLKRLDFLGRSSTMWSLHPPFRSQQYADMLPSIINRIRSQDIPAEQRGSYNIVDELYDWKDERSRNSRLKRWCRHINAVRLALGQQ